MAGVFIGTISAAGERMQNTSRIMYYCRSVSIVSSCRTNYVRDRSSVRAALRNDLGNDRVNFSRKETGEDDAAIVENILDRGKHHSRSSFSIDTRAERENWSARAGSASFEADCIGPSRVTSFALVCSRAH